MPNSSLDYYNMLMFALIAVMIAGAVIQVKLQSTFKKYSKITSKNGKTAVEITAQLLRQNNCNTSISQVSGFLTDHYNPKTNTIALSDSVYYSTSVAALAVATHELGHVLQHKEGYLPIKIRNAILPVANIGSHIAPLIVVVGILLAMANLTMFGAILYAAVLGFQIVTLPVEFNASRRAIDMLTAGGYIDQSERKGAKKVLGMAAMTYVVSTLATLITLLRLVLMAKSSRRD